MLVRNYKKNCIRRCPSPPLDFKILIFYPILIKFSMKRPLLNTIIAVAPQLAAVLFLLILMSVCIKYFLLHMYQNTILHISQAIIFKNQNMESSKKPQIIDLSKLDLQGLTSLKNSLDQVSSSTGISFQLDTQIEKLGK